MKIFSATGEKKMIEYTITVTIPSEWLPDDTVDQDELRQALKLGLAQLRQQKANAGRTEQANQALLSTGRVHHLSTLSAMDEERASERQSPPDLPGTPVSEVLIAQRREKP
jgi:adenylylsulfate kinase-like enzyme